MSITLNDSIPFWDQEEKRVFDISISLSSDTLTFPGQPRFQKEILSSIERGDRSNVSKLMMTSHTGTHVDAPKHFVGDMDSIDKVPFSRIIGPACVYELNVSEKIDAVDVQSLEIAPGDIVLFKTRNSELLTNTEFRKDYVYLTGEAAEVLKDTGVAAVGLDYLIVDEFDNTARPVHHILLRKGIILIEGLNLGHISAGDYYLICLPLKIRDGDGAPARAVLIEL